MKKITDLSGLLTNNLKKLYSSEQQLINTLPRLVDKANSSALKSEISSYIADKKANMNRLKSCFDLLDTSPGRHQCEITKALIEDCESAVDNSAESHVADAALIGTLQQINHFKIANYGTATSYARTLEKKDISQLLRDALVDERKADEEFTKIAEKNVNPPAAVA